MTLIIASTWRDGVAIRTDLGQFYSCKHDERRAILADGSVGTSKATIVFGRYVVASTGRAYVYSKRLKQRGRQWLTSIDYREALQQLLGSSQFRPRDVDDVVEWLLRRLVAWRTDHARANKMYANGIDPFGRQTLLVAGPTSDGHIALEGITTADSGHIDRQRRLVITDSKESRLRCFGIDWRDHRLPLATSLSDAQRPIEQVVAEFQLAMFKAVRDDPRAIEEHWFVPSWQEWIVTPHGPSKGRIDWGGAFYDDRMVRPDLCDAYRSFARESTSYPELRDAWRQSINIAMRGG
jgi:hypothetical protein